jgi:hypothetical protein
MMLFPKSISPLISLVRAAPPHRKSHGRMALTVLWEPSGKGAWRKVPRPNIVINTAKRVETKGERKARNRRARKVVSP